MKVVSKSEETEIIGRGDEFVGLARDKDGDFVIISSLHVIWLAEHPWSEDRDTAFEDYSPFTKYNGQLVLEND